MTDAATTRLAARLRGLPGPEWTVRPVVDADGHALTALISGVYDEYDCGPMDPEVFDADLALPATSAAASRRRWWVVEARRPDEGPTGPMASVAHGPLRTDADGHPTVELHRLYLAPPARGLGLATALLAGIAGEARTAGALRLEAWSDTRLVDAHTRYLSFGFVLTGARRELGDPAGTTELLFSLPLDGGPSSAST